MGTDIDNIELFNSSGETSIPLKLLSVINVVAKEIRIHICSLYKPDIETFSVAIAEEVALEKPVITNNISLFREIISEVGVLDDVDDTDVFTGPSDRCIGMSGGDGTRVSKPRIKLLNSSVSREPSVTTYSCIDNDRIARMSSD